MTAQEAGLDGEFRQRVVGTMMAVLIRLLDRHEPVTEDMRLMEELGLSSTLGLELLLETEDQLAVFIDVELMDQDQMKTVGDLATFVAGHSRPAVEVVFVAQPPATSPCRRDLHLIRAVRRTFTGPAEFLADRENRARVREYLTDMARPYARAVSSSLFDDPPSPALGQSYGEMAQPLIGSVVSADEPVDLLVLAFSVHDLRPGRQTAAYLSHVTPGAPMAFAICDQGSAAAFSGLRIAREYASSAGITRALVIVAEQAALPYDCPVPLPSQHRAVAMLYSAMPRGDRTTAQATVADVRQHPAVPPGGVADLAAADLTELAAGHREVGLVLSAALGAVWTAPAAGRVRVMPAGQPSTEVWWGLIDELTSDADHPRLLVVADYDPGLGCLCLTAFDTGPRAT